MEKEKATEVRCKTCEESRQVKDTQKFVLIFGAIFTFFGLYGMVSFIKDMIALF